MADDFYHPKPDYSEGNQTTSEPEDENKGSKMIWIVLSIFAFLALSATALFYSGFFNAQPILKTASICDDAGVKFELLSCEYFLNNSKYQTTIKFRKISEGNQLSKLFAFFRLENNKLKFEGINGALQTNREKELSFSLYSLPEKFYLLGNLANSKNSCSTPDFSCVQVDNTSSVAATPPANANQNNTAPVANAGINQTVNQSDSVTLNGSGSYDADRDNLTYSWTQLTGTGVSFNNRYSANPTFIAPQTNTIINLIFQLIVNDGKLNSLPKNITITVLNQTSSSQQTQSSGSIPPPPPLPS